MPCVRSEESLGQRPELKGPQNQIFCKLDQFISPIINFHDDVAGPSKHENILGSRQICYEWVPKTTAYYNLLNFV